MYDMPLFKASRENMYTAPDGSFKAENIVSFTMLNTRALLLPETFLTTSSREWTTCANSSLQE
jgi:hypothetical protein